MMSYYDLVLPLRSLVILIFFLTVCLGWYLVPTVCRRRGRLQVFFLLAGTLISAALMIGYTAQARAALRELEVPSVSKYLCEQPLLLPVGWLLANISYMGWLLWGEWSFRKNTITRSSIKEGVDKISSGLCFYTKEGRVVLVNSRMNELSHRIIGRDIQDAALLWRLLSGGEVRKDVVRLSYGSYPNFRLPDGSVWTFTREEVDELIQLTAVDTTLQQSLTDELREKNLDLAAMNLRLRHYRENVDELARAKERLETKVRIHGELGQALLATRQYLADPNAHQPPMDIWRRNIAMLRKEMEAQKEGDPLAILRKAAQSAGISLNIIGTLPDKTEYRQFFLTAASEAMTNAVFHANARILRIELTENENGWQMIFSNDGVQPKKPIVEGGGLSSLRRKAEYIGAVMTVRSTPRFAVMFEGRK